MAEVRNEASIRAQIEVLMKQKDVLKNAIREDTSKREKQKEEHAKVVAELAVLGRQLIDLKKESALATKPAKSVQVEQPKPVVEDLPPPAPDDAPPPAPEDPEPMAAPTLENQPSFMPPPPEDTLAPPDEAPPPDDLPPPPPEDDNPPPPTEDESAWLKALDLSKAVPSDIAQQIFAKYDADNNGFLDEQEVKLFLAEYSKAANMDLKAVAAAFWKKFDANGDKKISKDELLLAIQAPKFMFSDSVHEGQLMRKFDKKKPMTRHYFVLNKDKMSFYERPDKIGGELELTSSCSAFAAESKTGFLVCSGTDKVFECEAADAADRAAWLNQLDKQIYQKFLQASVDPKRKEDQPKGTWILKMFKIVGLSNTRLLFNTGTGLLGGITSKVLGLNVTFRLGSTVLKTRTFEGTRAVYNQVFVIPKSQWPQGTEMVCDIMDQGSTKTKSVGTAKFAWPESKDEGFYKGTYYVSDKEGASGQISLALIDADVVTADEHLRMILSPDPLVGIDQYEMGKQLGKGGCGTVYLAKHKLTHHEVAIKVVAKEKEFEVRTEMDVMQMLKHPNCVRLEEMMEKKTNIYMIMELMGDNLQSRIYDKHNGQVPEDICRVWMKDTASALEYCHELGVVHRDIKPENLMFGAASSVIKLTDFGLATYKQAVMKDSCGTPPFMAPELVLQKPYGKEVDMWALGVSLYQCLIGAMPFDQPQQELMFIAIKRSSYLIRPEWNLSPEVVHLLKCLLEVDPKLRLTATQMLEHPWVRGEPMGDYIVPNRRDVYEAVKVAAKPRASGIMEAVSPQRRRFVSDGDD